MSNGTPGGIFIELTASIVSAYVSNNSVPASDLPALISQVHGALTRIIVRGQSEAASEARRPAVSEAVCLRVAFDMRAQFCNRAELHRSVRQLGLDRSVSIKRVGHAIDHAGFENCVALRLFERCGLWRVIFGGYVMLRRGRFD